MSTSDTDAENLCVPNPAVQTINAISSRHSFQSFSLFFFFWIANPLRQESIKSVPFFIFFGSFQTSWTRINEVPRFVTRLVWAGMTQVNRWLSGASAGSAGGSRGAVFMIRVRILSWIAIRSLSLSASLSLISFLLFAFSSGCWILQDVAAPRKENKKGGMEKKNVGFAKGWNDVQENFCVWLQGLFLFSWKISKKRTSLNL